MFVGWLCIPVIILYRYIIYKYFLLFCGWQGLLPPSEAGKGEERFNPQPQREHGWQLDFSTLAWKIPWTEEPGSLQSMRSLRVRHDWAISLWLFHFHALEKEMATHSSILAWRIPGMGEPGGLPSMGSHRVGHDWSDLAAAAAAYWKAEILLCQQTSV